MKKKILKLLGLVIVSLMPMMVNAASGKISVTSSSTVVVGNQVKVTVTMSSSTEIGSWEIQLDYDKNYLSLVSSSAEAGGTYMVNSSSGTTSKTYTFTFKALKSGSTKVSISSYDVYAYSDMSNMSMTISNKTITIKTQAEVEASYSSDNYLKSLSIDGYELDPEFNKETLEYTVSVPTTTTSITIDATTNDSKSSVTGLGEYSVDEGTNTFEIVVTAQNGSTKTYTLYVEVEDENPIKVTIDNEEYTVVKRKESLEAPSNYEETTITINDTEVPAFFSDTTNFTLVGLKTSDGTIIYGIYNTVNDTYSIYNEVKSNNLILYIVDLEELDGYIIDKAIINDLEVNVAKYSADSRYSIVYAMNVETGEYNYYSYDSEDFTFQLWNTEEIDDLNEMLETFTLVLILFGVSLVIMFICLICVSKGKKKEKKEKSEIYKDDNEIIEEKPKKNKKVNNQDKDKEIGEEKVDNKKENKSVK